MHAYKAQYGTAFITFQLRNLSLGIWNQFWAWYS